MADSNITSILKAVFAFGSIILLFVLSNIYFQQDEWHSFGIMLGYEKDYLLLGKSLWQAILADRIGARAIMYGLFTTYGLNAAPFGFLASILHILNAYLVVRLVYACTRNQTVSWFSGLFFLTNAVSHQAYSWFGTMAGSTPAVTCILFSLLSFTSYLHHRKITDYVSSFMFVWISFLFKETGFFLFLVYPALWIVHTKKRTWKRFLSHNALWMVYGTGMAILLVYIVLTIPGDRANYIAPERSGYESLLVRSLVYPLEGSVHAFMPAEIVYTSAALLTRLIRPDLEPETSSFDIFYQTHMVEYISLFLGIALLAGLWKWRAHTTLMTGALMIYASFAPYIVLARFDAYLDSRYYYTPLIGTSLIFGYIMHKLVQKYRIPTYAIASIIVLAHASYLSIQLTEQYQRSAERKHILTQVAELVTLDERTVLYVTGNTPGYYGIEELKVPFQSGFGHVLMVLYGYEGTLPKGFFREKTLTDALGVGFLYDTLAQGYKEIDGKGFGYFYDENVLNEHLQSGEFSEEDVVRLFYDSDTKNMVLR